MIPDSWVSRGFQRGRSCFFFSFFFFFSSNFFPPPGSPFSFGVADVVAVFFCCFTFSLSFLLAPPLGCLFFTALAPDTLTPVRALALLLVQPPPPLCPFFFPQLVNSWQSWVSNWREFGALFFCFVAFFSRQFLAKWNVGTPVFPFDP